MKLITVASKKEGYFNILEKTCKKNNLDLITLGYGKKYKGNQWKLELVYNYLKLLKQNEIVLFTDAYDVIILKNKNEILKRFKKFKKPIVFSVNYYNNNIFTYFFSILKYGTCENHILNSGTYIGYSKYLMILLKESLKYIKNEESDQRLLMELCRTNKIFKKYIEFDRKYSIFYVPHCSFFDTYKQLKMERGFRDIECNLKDFSKSCIIHGPGNQNLNKIVKKLNYKIPKQRINTGTKVFFSKSKKNYIIFGLINICFIVLIILLFIFKKFRIVTTCITILYLIFIFTILFSIIYYYVIVVIERKKLNNFKNFS